jgi:hypothetical protein
MGGLGRSWWPYLCTQGTCTCIYVRVPFILQLQVEAHAVLQAQVAAGEDSPCHSSCTGLGSSRCRWPAGWLPVRQLCIPKRCSAPRKHAAAHNSQSSAVGVCGLSECVCVCVCACANMYSVPWLVCRLWHSASCTHPHTLMVLLSLVLVRTHPAAHSTWPHTHLLGHRMNTHAFQLAAASAHAPHTSDKLGCCCVWRGEGWGPCQW